MTTTTTTATPWEVRQLLDRHVTAARAAGSSLDDVRADLLAAGWHPLDVDAAMRRADAPPEHAFGYSWLFFSLGFASVSLAGTLHVVLDGLKDLPNRGALVAWLTVFVCSAPFAVAAAVWADRTERAEPAARRSTTRHSLAQVLLWATGLVGMIRLVEFVGRFLSSVLDPSPYRGDHPLIALCQVAVTVVVAGGVFWWTWAYDHDRPAER